MKKRNFAANCKLFCGFLSGLTIVVCVAASTIAAALTIDDLIKLHQAKLSDAVIKAHVEASGMKQELTVADTLALKKAGFADDLIEFIIRSHHKALSPNPAGAAEATAPNGNPAAPESPAYAEPEAIQQVQPASPVLCNYLIKLQQVSDRYDMDSKSSMDLLQTTLDPKIVERMASDHRDLLKFVSMIEAPSEALLFHTDLVNFLTHEVQLYDLLQSAILGDTEAVAAAAPMAMSLLTEGKRIYSTQNDLRKRCGMIPLPSLSMLPS